MELQIKIKDVEINHLKEKLNKIKAEVNTQDEINKLKDQIKNYQIYFDLLKN